MSASGAANAVNPRNKNNGWVFWWYLRPSDGSRRPIRFIREGFA